MAKKTLEGTLSSVYAHVYDEQAGLTKVETKDGVVVSKVYTLDSPTKKLDSITIYDESLIASIDKIKVAMAVSDRAYLIIAKELSNIADSGKLEALGFSNIEQFASRMFDIASTTTQFYVRIGRFLLDSDYTPVAGLPKTLKISQLLEIVTCLKVNSKDDVTTKVIPAFANSTISDGMSARRMREALRKADKVIELKESQVVSETATESATETATETVTESVTETAAEVAAANTSSPMLSLLVKVSEARDAVEVSIKDSIIEAGNGAFMEYLDSATKVIELLQSMIASN